MFSGLSIAPMVNYGYGLRMSEITLLANTAGTLFMVGLIWFVQRVHYPLLAQVDVKDQKSVGHEHQRRTSQVVGLPMAVEGVSTLVLLVSLLAISLGSTVFLSVPLHEKMISKPSSQIGKKLVATNWPRTISWTLRGFICLLMCAQTIN
jgi:hypothetical protein